MNNGQWSWNYPNDDWWSHDNFDTKEEAIQDAKENYNVKDEDIEIGQIKLVPLPTYIDTDDLFEKLDEQYSEDLADYDDYLFNGVTKEQREELESKLADVLKLFYKKVGITSNYYTIYNQHTIHIE